MSVSFDNCRNIPIALTDLGGVVDTLDHQGHRKVALFLLVPRETVFQQPWLSRYSDQSVGDQSDSDERGLPGYGVLHSGCE